MDADLPVVEVSREPECSVRAACAVPPEVSLERLRGHLTRAALMMASPVSRVHVEIVDEAAMARLHERHSGIAGSTDVLTFPSRPSEPDSGTRHGGLNELLPIDVDIVACVDEASRRGAEFGHGAEREILLYAVHGLLHCAGFDDHDPDSFDRMHLEEERILDAIGVGATFRPKPAARPESSGRSIELREGRGVA